MNDTVGMRVDQAGERLADVIRGVLEGQGTRLGKLRDRRSFRNYLLDTRL